MGTLAARIGQTLPHDPTLGPLDDVLGGRPRPTLPLVWTRRGCRPGGGIGRRSSRRPHRCRWCSPSWRSRAPIAGFQAPGVGELTDTKVTGGQGATAVAAGGTMVAGGGGRARRDQGRPRGALRRRGLRPLEGRGGGRRCRRRGPASVRGWVGGPRTWVIAGVALALVLLAAGLSLAFGTNVLTPSHPTPTLANLTVAERPVAGEGAHQPGRGDADQVDHGGFRRHRVAEPQGRDDGSRRVRP